MLCRRSNGGVLGGGDEWCPVELEGETAGGCPRTHIRADKRRPDCPAIATDTCCGDNGALQEGFAVHSGGGSGGGDGGGRGGGEDGGRQPARVARLSAPAAGARSVCQLWQPTTHVPSSRPKHRRVSAAARSLHSATALALRPGRRYLQLRKSLYRSWRESLGRLWQTGQETRGCRRSCPPTPRLPPPPRRRQHNRELWGEDHRSCGHHALFTL